ncbi:oxidoreductase [Salinisphaera sp. SPP-AMP-43]|uniref:oxidoreductase n=1 Tax=Salinisphaera sp. SPP-AMP-43 TaxID=3121288 RepID=UPI003C6DD029
MDVTHWTEADIPDLTGRRAVVTGATSALGREIARALLANGAEVILAVRDRARGEALAALLGARDPAVRPAVRELDLASLGSIHSFAATLIAEVDRLDLLVNSAGVVMPPLGRTEDGFELQMGTNHFGTFALTARLWPLLKATPNSRVTVTSSIAHRRGGPHLADLDWRLREYDAGQAYSDSKLANLLFVYELDRRRTGTEPKVCACHPGWIRSGLQQHSGMARFFRPIRGMPAAQGALATLRAAVDPNAVSGDFFGPDGVLQMRGYPVRVEPVEFAKDPGLAQDLWEISAERTGIDFKLNESEGVFAL